MASKLNMTRRDFLRVSTGIASGIASATLLPGCAVSKNHIYLSELGGMPVVSGYRPKVSGAWIPKGEHKDSYGLFKKMVESATDFSWLSKGDRVLLKLAMNSDIPYPATTDPWAVWSMTKLLKEKGAGKITIGDQSGVQRVLWTKAHTRGSSRSCSESAGLFKTIIDSESTPCFFEEKGYSAYKETLPPGIHHWESPIWVTSVLDEVDHIIYMPRVSSHVLGDITSGMKLGVGFLREDSRLAFHRGGDNFYAMYEEINQVPEIVSRFRLVVSSGRSVLSTFGPDYGAVTEPDQGLVFASDDLLAHELLAYAWLEWNREFETSYLSDATTGSLNRYRSVLNKLFVWWVWGDDKETPGIPLFQPGDINSHPSILNAMKRKGGRPEDIPFEQVNNIPGDSIAKYLENKMKMQRVSL
jgi:uncharacterized protein (DUF362 family)